MRRIIIFVSWLKIIIPHNHATIAIISSPKKISTQLFIQSIGFDGWQGKYQGFVIAKEMGTRDRAIEANRTSKSTSQFASRRVSLLKPQCSCCFLVISRITFGLSKPSGADVRRGERI
jgi:hypothetical protein